MQPVVHHVEICVHNGKRTLLGLKKFGFRPFAERETSLCKQWVTKLGGIIFVINERRDHTKNVSSQTSILPEPFTAFCCKDTHAVDSVFNIAFSVKDVADVTSMVEYNGGDILKPLTTVEDAKEGRVSYSIVRSCCGNVLHTLINKNEYSGEFLPGFTRVSDIDHIEDGTLIQNLNKKVTHIDHVTLACNPGHSERVISWYESCFGMQRFSISRDDDDDEGLILEDGVGLRLRAMEYWRCAETGLIYPCDKNRERNENGVMLVVVETLPGQNNCNVETFLREHNGPGVEHIAFSTSNICETVEVMKSLRVKFRQPPAAYYEELRKVKKIENIGENFEQLEKLGILLDNEVEPDTENNTGSPKTKTGYISRMAHFVILYLMQIFAHPLFAPRKTFFIEVIQRFGARGLGSGNIIALVKSIREDERRRAAEANMNNINDVNVNGENSGISPGRSSGISPGSSSGISPGSSPGSSSEKSLGSSSGCSPEVCSSCSRCPRSSPGNRPGSSLVNRLGGSLMNRPGSISGNSSGSSSRSNPGSCSESNYKSSL